MNSFIQMFGLRVVSVAAAAAMCDKTSLAIDVIISINL